MSDSLIDYKKPPPNAIGLKNLFQFWIRNHRLPCSLIVANILSFIQPLQLPTQRLEVSFVEKTDFVTTLKDFFSSLPAEL